MNLKITHDWFYEKDFAPFLKLNPEEEIHILEIGSHEGKSTVWFINNFLRHPASTITCVDPWLDNTQDDVSIYSKKQSDTKKSFHENFLHNISETGKKERVNIKVGLSNLILPTLEQKYDLVFIDGNHTAKFVLEDSVLSFLLLKSGGYMVWDDYRWKNFFNPSTKYNTPKLAVDSFLSCYHHYLDVLLKKSKVVARKKVDFPP